MQTRKDLEESERAREELQTYLGEIIELRRAEPRNDLISDLIAAEAEGDRLSYDEMVIILILLLLAGNITTTNLIGNGTLALLEHPDQARKLRDDPALIESAVEEMLRFDSPVQFSMRVALDDVEIGGRHIRPGESVLTLLGSANRDSEVFRDSATFDVTRNDRSHVAFGRGIHHCLGAPLARLEGQIAFGRLFERFAALELAAPPRHDSLTTVRGLESLRVRVTPATTPERQPAGSITPRYTAAQPGERGIRARSDTQRGDSLKYGRSMSRDERGRRPPVATMFATDSDVANMARLLETSFHDWPDVALTDHLM